MWAEELQNTEFGRDITEAEQMLALHNDSTSHMQNGTYQVMQSGQELLQVSSYSNIYWCKIKVFNHFTLLDI